jgi:hypothetical protein
MDIFFDRCERCSPPVLHEMAHTGKIKLDASAVGNLEIHIRTAGCLHLELGFGTFFMPFVGLSVSRQVYFILLSRSRGLRHRKSFGAVT